MFRALYLLNQRSFKIRPTNGCRSLCFWSLILQTNLFFQFRTSLSSACYLQKREVFIGLPRRHPPPKNNSSRPHQKIPKVSPPTKKPNIFSTKSSPKKNQAKTMTQSLLTPNLPPKTSKKTMARRLARGLSLALLCSVAFVRPGPVRPERTARAASTGLWQEALTAERGRAELLLSKLQERNKLSSTIPSKRRDLIGLLWDLIGFIGMIMG